MARPSSQSTPYPADSNNRLIGVALVGAAMAAFSFKAILVKMIYSLELGLPAPIDPVTILAFRMAFALPCFLLIGTWLAANGRQKHHRLSGREWGAVVGLGLLGYYLSALLDVSGLQYISAGLERLILFVYPTLVVGLLALWRWELPARTTVLALMITYAGVALAVGDGLADNPNVMLGSALVAGSTLSFALYSLLAAHFIRRLGPALYTVRVMTVSAAAMLLHFGLRHGVDVAVLHTPQAGAFLMLTLAMALGSTVLPSFLIASGVARIGADNAAVIGSVGPIFTIVLANQLLGEIMSPMQFAGAALVIAGVWVIGRK